MNIIATWLIKQKIETLRKMKQYIQSLARAFLSDTEALEKELRDFMEDIKESYLPPPPSFSWSENNWKITPV